MNTTNYPIVNVKTEDELTLHGILTEPVNPAKTIVIHIHGSSGNFYWNSYFELLTKSVVDLGIAYLATNNRGSGVYELVKGEFYHGVSLEKFEDCLLDIDAWIEFALSKGYENIILEGHSYGTEKSVYYMNKGKYANKVTGVMLFGFSDNVGTQIKYEKNIGKSYRQEAEELNNKGESWKLLSDYFGLCGEMPISAQTYLHGFTEDSENAIALPLRQGRDLTFFQNIKVPILGVISDDEDGEYTVIPIKDAVELLRSENELAEACIIKDTNHVFAGKEKELVDIVMDFLERRLLN
jgi:alpha/beta superfamily hydrolase